MCKLTEILMFSLVFKCCLTQRLDYPIYFAEDICDEKIRIGSQPNNSSFLIKLRKNNSSKTIESCKVVIETTDDRKIHTNVKNMIDEYKDMDLKSQNTITFTKNNENRQIAIKFNGLGDDIHLVVTSYQYVNEGQNCPKLHFLCEKNKCIHQIYRCDSYFNCANDENELACALGNTILLTIILAILTSLFGTTCLLSSYVYFRYYHKKQRLLDSKQIMYGTVNTSTPVSVQHSMKVYK